MKGTIYKLAKDEVYNTVLNLLDGRDPSTIHDMLDPDHVIFVMDSINKRLDVILALE